jgi:hypothetical protein
MNGNGGAHESGWLCAFVVSREGGKPRGSRRGPRCCKLHSREQWPRELRLREVWREHVSLVDSCWRLHHGGVKLVQWGCTRGGAGVSTHSRNAEKGGQAVRKQGCYLICLYLMANGNNAVVRRAMLSSHGKPLKKPPHFI